MEIIYRAFDGQDFDNEGACKKYEQDILKIRMWDGNGRTDSLDDAQVIHAPEGESVKALIERCEMEGIVIDGFEEPGWYFWDSSSCAWFFASEWVMRACHHALIDAT